jgi:hypothetical protein
MPGVAKSEVKAVVRSSFFVLRSSFFVLRSSFFVLGAWGLGLGNGNGNGCRHISFSNDRFLNRV